MLKILLLITEALLHWLQVPGSVVDCNLWGGLAGHMGLHSLVLAECSGRLVRHLVAAHLPCLARLELRNMGAALRCVDLNFSDKYLKP